MSLKNKKMSNYHFKGFIKQPVINNGQLFSVFFFSMRAA